MALIGQKPYNSFTDPKRQVFSSVIQDNLGVWNATTWRAAGTANFNTMISYRGSTVSCTALAADTYKTIVSATGEGFLGAIIFPRAVSGNAAVWTVETTIDGVVTERITPSNGNWNARRLMLGPYPFEGATNGTGWTLAQGGYQMSGNSFFENGDGLGGIIISTGAQDYVPVVPVTAQLQRGQPCLKFNQSMSIRFKCSLAMMQQGDNHAGVLYIVNP